MYYDFLVLNRDYIGWKICNLLQLLYEFNLINILNNAIYVHLSPWVTRASKIYEKNSLSNNIGYAIYLRLFAPLTQARPMPRLIVTCLRPRRHSGLSLYACTIPLIQHYSTQSTYRHRLTGLQSTYTYIYTSSLLVDWADLNKSFRIYILLLFYHPCFSFLFFFFFLVKWDFRNGKKQKK